MEHKRPLPATRTRVSAHTSPQLNEAILDRTSQILAELEHDTRNRIADRLSDLDREWDVERFVQLNSSLVALVGLSMAMRGHRKFLVMPAVAYTFVMMQSLQGWCPPLPILRRIGVRTVAEIERERYALKALRGDMADISDRGKKRVASVLKAIDL